MLSMVIDSISSFMYSKLLVIMLIGTGVYFTIRTKFPQVRLFRSACKAVMEKPDDEDAVSSFQALMVSTASRVGTGLLSLVSLIAMHWTGWNQESAKTMNFHMKSEFFSIIHWEMWSDLLQMKGAISSVWDAGKYIVMSAHVGKHLQNIKNAEMSMYVSGSREEVFCSLQ